MARTPLTKAKKIILLILALMALISSVVVSIAVFTDRVNRTTTIQVSTFDDDGYSIERTAPEGYVTAGETLEVTLNERNDKSENITSQITMTISWDSPVPNVYPWGNSSTENAVIKLGDTEITYTVNTDKTITFTLPETALKAGSDVTSKLTFQIPADLASTGTLNFNFDRIDLGYASWTANYDDTKLDALDFSVDVAWNISKNPTNTVTGKPNLDVIAVLKDTDNDGKYELEIIKNGSGDNTNKGQMMDWTAEGQTPWSNFPIEDLTIDDGVTTIGDYAFAGETGIASVDIPDTITHIGTSAFDGSGLTGELTIPASVKEIESLGFGNLPGVKEITFEHDSDDTLKLPDNESAGKENTGAFYVPVYVKTTINTDNKAIEYDYRWHNDNRKPIPTLAAQDTWYTGATAKNTISSIAILDYYEPAGTLTEPAWDASAAKDGSVMAYVEPDGSGGYKLTIAGNGYGLIYANADSTYAFGAEDSVSAKAFSKATTFTGLNLLDTSHTTTMKGMFKGCSNLTSLDVSTFDTQKVTNMNSTFYDCAKLTALDVSQFDIQDVTDTSSMFYNCATLTKLDVDGFDTRNVEDMSSMFAYCEKLTSLDVGLFDTQKVTTTQSMFEGCYVLPKLDVKKETVTLNGRTYTAWDTGAVTTMESMFAYCNELGAMDLSNWDATSVETMYQMFYNCYKMPSVDLTNFSTSSLLKSMGSTFYQCQSLPTVDLSSFTTTGLEDMSATFFSCYDLTDVTFGSNFDASAVKTIRAMFAYCSSLTEFDFSDFNTSSALENMYMLFSDCTNLQSVDFSSFDTSSVTNMASMFHKCKNLLELDLSMFDTSKVTTTSAMFNECNILTTIYVSCRWSNASNNYSTGMFSNCYALVGGAGTPYSSDYIEATRALIDGEGGKPGYFTNNIFLSYEDVAVGDTVDSELTIKSAVFDDYTSISYSVINGSTYASVDSKSGTVTGLAAGTATVRVTLGAANGDTISADADVNVYSTVPTLAATNTWFTPSVSTVKKASITSVTIKDTYTAGTLVDSWPAAVDEDGNGTLDSDIMAYVEDDGSGNGTYKLTLAGNGSGYIYANPDSQKAFQSFSAMTTFNNASLLDTSKVVYFGGSYLATGMFHGCESLKTIDVSKWNTGNAKSMISMFQLCKSLESIDVSDWETGKVTTMASMFSNCQTLKTIDVSNWDTSKVKGMNDVFAQCSALETLDVSKWDTSSATTMSQLFYLCESVKQLDVSKWNTSNVTNMKNMFAGCETIPSLDVLPKAVTVDGTTYTAWDTGLVSNMSAMFGGCTSLTTLDVSKMNTSSVQTMRQMFNNCSVLPSVNVLKKSTTVNGTTYTAWDTSKVTDMGWMFRDCAAMTEIDVSTFNTANVTDTSRMFLGCTGITTVPVSDWTTSSLEDISGMFQDCTKLTNLNLSKWNTSNLKKIGYSSQLLGLFYNCSALNDLNVSGWNTSLVTDFNCAFNGCSSLQTLDLTNWSTASATNTANMFKGMRLLDTVTLDTNFAFLTDDTTSYLPTPDGNYITGAHGIWYNNSTWADYTPTTLAEQHNSKATYVVTRPLPILAAQETWYTQGGTSIAKSSISSIDIKDSYTPTGTVADSWDASAGKIGTITAYLESDGSGGYKLTIAGTGYGKIYTNADSYLAFAKFTNATAINGATLLDTSNTTTMTAMFWNCNKLTTIDVSGFDTSNVEHFNTMFRYCNVLETVAVGNWNTGKAITFDSMFDGCYKLSAIDVATKTVTANGSTYTAWDMSSAEDLDYMFDFCESLTTLDVADWNLDKVKSAKGAFQGCTTLETLDVSQWTFSTNLTDTSAMFNSCESLKELKVENWIMDNVTDTNTMFNECETLTTLAVDDWNVGNVQDMDFMFADCYNLSSLNVSKWDVSKVTGMELMFSYCHSLPTLAVDNWQVQNVEDMRAMFIDCRSLTTLNVSNWETTSLTQITHKYGEYDSTADASYYWDRGMFEGCTKLAVIDISGWDMGQITNTAHMFSDCYALKSLTIPASLSVISPEFAYNCTALTEITFNHGANDALSMPTAGAASAEKFTAVQGVNGEYSDGGAFYVPSYLATTINAAHATAKNYDWFTDNRASALPVLASDSDWYTQGGTTISQKNITSIILVDEVDSATKTAAGDNYWDASDGQIGTVTAYAVDDGSGNSTYTLTIAGNGYGSIYANEDSSHAFSNSMSNKRFSNLTSITGLELLDTSNVTNMDSMFYSCQKLTSLDVSTFDTSKVESMADMFSYCKALETLNISSKKVTMNGRTYDSWDTGAVDDTSCMFQFCSKLPSLDVSHFDTRKVTTTVDMFNNCNALTSLNLSSKSVTMNGRTYDSWDTGTVENMDSMFSVCSVLPSLDVGHFDTSKVADMQYMFSSCPALATLNVSSKSVTMNGRTYDSWDTGNVLYMNHMFNSCKALPSLDVSHFDTSKVTTMADTFSHCEGITSLNVGTKSVTMNGRTFNSWDTGAVTRMNDMFNCCHSLVSLDTSHFDTAAVTDMGSMFYYNDLLTSLDISPKSMTLNGRTFTSWNTGNVTNMRAMFGACEVLTTLDLGHFDTSQVTDMSGMFRWCEKLYTLDISSFNTSKVTDMGQMFSVCKVLPSLDVSHFDTSNVTNMYQMFDACYDATNIKFSSKFKTDKVTNMGSMFSNCYVLTELDLSSFSTASITSSDGLAAFAYNSWALTTIILNENFVTDASLLPVAGFEPFGMFYAGNYIDTTLVNPTDAMLSYDWEEDNRTIIVKPT